MAYKKRKVAQAESVHEEEEQQADYEAPEHQHQDPAAGDPADCLAGACERAGEDHDEEGDEDVSKLLEPLTKDQLISLLRTAALSDPNILAEIRRLADLDPSHRKIFVHGLNWTTSADTLRSCFSRFGEIDDCRVVTDRNTGKSKGYGFVLFRHRRSAQRALRSPQNQIDGRMTACQLASVGPGGPHQGQPQQGQQPYQQHPGVSDTLSRKIYVGNVRANIDGSQLLEFFSKYGEIEEGPLGFDRQTGRPKGFALFIYRTIEGARKALEEPNKNFDGHLLICQKATDGQRNKAAAAVTAPATPSGSNLQGGVGYNIQGSDGYNIPGTAGNYNAAMDMALGQGVMGGAFPFGQGLQANAAALAMLAAAGQNPAAYGIPPALFASLNPVIAAAMSAGASPMAMQAQVPQQGYGMPMAMQAQVPQQGYGMTTAGYQNVGYQTPQQPVNQGGVTYQAAPIGQAPVARPPVEPMGGYGTH